LTDEKKSKRKRTVDDDERKNRKKEKKDKRKDKKHSRDKSDKGTSFVCLFIYLFINEVRFGLDFRVYNLRHYFDNCFYKLSLDYGNKLKTAFRHVISC
jgi:hypothetical protein